MLVRGDNFLDAHRDWLSDFDRVQRARRAPTSRALDEASQFLIAQVSDE
jgi:hypothetical protein